MRGLRDKVMVVAGGGTGAAGPGNGAATAIRLADEGARVVVGDLSPDAAAATVALIAERGGTASAFGFDIADEASVQELVTFAVTTYGGLDGVHASAADMSPATLGRDSETDAVTIPLDVWQRTLDVNLTGFLLVVKAAVPADPGPGRRCVGEHDLRRRVRRRADPIGLRDDQGCAHRSHASRRVALGDGGHPLQLDCAGPDRTRRRNGAGSHGAIRADAAVTTLRPARGHRRRGCVPAVRRR